MRKFLVLLMLTIVTWMHPGFAEEEMSFTERMQSLFPSMTYQQVDELKKVYSDVPGLTDDDLWFLGKQYLEERGQMKLAQGISDSQDAPRMVQQIDHVQKVIQPIQTTKLPTTVVKVHSKAVNPLPVVPKVAQRTTALKSAAVAAEAKKVQDLGT